MIDLTAIIQAIIALMAAAVTTFLVPWLKGKVSETQWNVITSTVEHAVKAAEQLFNTGQGRQKKQYVLDYLASKGINVDDTIIESTVNAYFGKGGVTAGEFAEVE
jgi:hypothetical protein